MKLDTLDALRGFFAQAPFMVELGVEPVAVEPGCVTTVLRLERRHFQHTGQVHAGVMATLADHTMGAAAQSLLPAGRIAITAEFKTSLLRAARGERLVCTARVLKSGRTLVFTEAEVHAEPTTEGPAERALDAPAGGRVFVMKASATMAVTAAEGPAPPA